ncbi:MAG: SDR family oxidoreductase [Lachnospiraceae bacterium]|nr:SDR family oxidoreductase [Lachnospiraceae bacterium]
MGRLEGKVVLITGCSAGIGKQVALKFAEEGAKLVIDARREERLMESKTLCEERGGEVLAIPGDLCSMEHLKEMVDGAIKKFGKIDVLINNACLNTQGESILDTPDGRLRSIMSVNYFATWNLMKLCYPHMKANGGGSIVNICSGAGVMGMSGFGPYASSKEAVRGLSRVAAREWGPDHIRVNVVCPGCMTDTIQEVGYDSIMEKMAQSAPLRSCGDAYEDVAPVYLFFASDDSKHVTGQTLCVDGGTTITP